MPYIRKYHGRRKGAAFFATVLLFVFAACLFVGIFTLTGRASKTVSLGYDFYFLVKECESTTAGAVAGDVAYSGGAGYLYGDDVVLSAYFSETSALTVKERLSDKGVETSVKKLSCASFLLNGDNVSETAHIKANGETVHSIVKILYDTANDLEKTACSQEEARLAVRGAVNALKGLTKENTNAYYNAWNSALLSAARKGEEIASGIIFCKDVRYLEVQLAVTLLKMGEYF